MNLLLILPLLPTGHWKLCPPKNVLLQAEWGMWRLSNVTGVQISPRLREASWSRPNGLLTPGGGWVLQGVRGGSIQIPQKFQLKEKVDEGVEMETGRVFRQGARHRLLKRKIIQSWQSAGELKCLLWSLIWTYLTTEPQIVNEIRSLSIWEGGWKDGKMGKGEKV